MTKNKIYSKEVEAAWYVLKEFIDPLNCLEKYGTIKQTGDGEKTVSQSIQMNYNYVLCHHYSGTKAFPIFHYSKKLLDLHLSKEETHYYRSKRQARHSIGFGRTEKQAQSVLFSKEFDITEKRKEYSSYYVFLLGIDIDCHHNEPDVQELADWLKRDFFSQSYWEPSTNNLGKHGYVKIAYPDDLNIEYVRTVIEELFDLLRLKAKQLDFKASIDIPCGLPLSLTYDNLIEKPEHLPNLSIKEYNKYRQITSQIEDGQKDVPKFISGEFTYDDVVNLTKLKLSVSIKQSQCIKIPRFNCSDPDIISNLVDIKFFYKLSFMKLSNIFELRNKLITELGIEPKTKENNIGESEEDEKAPIVGSPSGNSGELVLQDNSQISLNNTDLTEESGVEYISPIVGSPKEPEIITKTKKSYSEYIEMIRAMTGSTKRTNKFYFYCSHYLGYVPDVTIAIDEYFNQKLNRNPDKTDKSRIRRFKFVKKQLDKKWDSKKRGLGLADWKDCKDKVISAAEKKLTCINRTYIKDKKRKQIYEISVEELAFIYFAIRKSNSSDKDKKSVMKYCFSLKQVQQCLLNQFGKFCPKVKAVRIRQILQEAALITYAGKYRVGEHGNSYKAADLKLEQAKCYGAVVRSVEVFPAKRFSYVLSKGSMFRIVRGFDAPWMLSGSAA